ncbi:MAG: Do family serine endopeptidase, partial [Rhodospirillaceae bacterium]|nr:Do family serine endopeptidase [Rhodospirillaceae bacterium]
MNLPAASLRRFGPRVAVAAIAGATAISAILYAGTAVTAIPQAADAEIIRPANGFADLVETVRPAVVNISTRTVQPASLQDRYTNHGGSQQYQRPGQRQFDGPPEMHRFMERFFGESFPQAPRGPMDSRSLGSGFIVDADGLVVTNHHVIRGADEIEVTLDSGEVLPAIVRGVDRRTDLALLEVETEAPLPYVSFGDSDHARVGDWVIAIGNPFGLGGTTTSGIVSARGRDINNGPYVDYIQIDASINRGNSGGPLFNDMGQVIGINTAIFSPNGGSVGIGFAIPASVAQGVVEQLREDGHVARAWLGVEIQPVTPEIAESLSLDDAHGALISRIAPESPAAQSDLRTGDVIIGLNGRQVKNTRQLPRMVAKTPAEEKVTVSVLRNGETLEIDAILKPIPESQQAMKPSAPNPNTGRLGLRLSLLDDKARDVLGYEGDGVLIQEVMPASPAARQGLRAGDIILKVGSVPVSTPQDVVGQVKKLKPAKKPVLLLVQREGNQ